jgi:hypothetical protein
MSGWDHTIRPYTDEELADWEAHEAKQNADPERRAWLERYYKGTKIYWTECSSPRCSERPIFEATYHYVTGRRGRVSYARKQYCRTHGERFAKKHGLEVDNGAKV